MCVYVRVRVRVCMCACVHVCVVAGVHPLRQLLTQLGGQQKGRQRETGRAREECQFMIMHTAGFFAVSVCVCVCLSVR